MDGFESFSALNERLRPRVTTSEQLYSTLNRLEDKQLGSLRNKYSSYRQTVLPADPQPKVDMTTTIEPEDSEGPEEDVDLESVASDEQEEGRSAELLVFDKSFPVSELNLKNLGQEEMVDEDGNISPSERKDVPGELASEGTGDSSESTLSTEGGNTLQRSYMDLPDLLRGGKPLGRRRTLGHVSATLKEVRREVELSRRRSIKLKAQVDKLQEGRDGKGWSQDKERVTEEVLSVLRLLQPLTDSSPPESSQGGNSLDVALGQLQNVARILAVSHTQQSNSGKAADDSAVLKQALRDRDEAIEKKKAMEDELLRSKTELMLLNNQLLEAVQKRLEMSLELETWKEDVQQIIHQQLQSQQQAEQAQKKPSRLGLLRRNKPMVQRPSPAPSPPTVNSNQIFISKSAVSSPQTPSTPPSAQRNWMDRLRRGKSSRPGEQEAPVPDSEFDNFTVVSLD